MAYKIEYILLIGILAFLLYHLLGSCNCNDGFSVGGCIQEIDSCENKVISKKDTPCNQLYEQNQFDKMIKTKCIVDTVNASNCVATPDLCNSDPMNPHGFKPISIDDIKKSKLGISYHIKAGEILIILKSNGSQTLEIEGNDTVFLYIFGNIYIESGATLNIKNFQVYYRDNAPPNSAATIINNGELNISNNRGESIFSGSPATNICKLTNNGIITFQGINPGSKKSQKSTSIWSRITYISIDITGAGEIIYNNAGISCQSSTDDYQLSVNIDNTQTFNKCTIISQTTKSLNIKKSFTLNMSSFYITTGGMIISAPANITINKSYIEIYKANFTSDNMTITDSNMRFDLQLNIKILTIDQSNLTVMNKANINSEVIIFKNESNLIIEKEWSGSFTKSNITIDYTSSIIVNE
jgi:hypothetical protein